MSTMRNYPIVLILIVAMGIGLAAVPFSHAQEIEVRPEDQVCETIEDCTIFDRTCSGCSCGIPVNKDFQKKYWDRIVEKCQHYRGPACDFMCGEILTCEENRCVHKTLPAVQR